MVDRLDAAASAGRLVRKAASSVADAGSTIAAIPGDTRMVGGVSVAAVDSFSDEELAAAKEFIQNVRKTQQAWLSAPIATNDDSLSAVNQAFREVGLDPTFAREITNRSWLLLSAPELVLPSRTEMQGSILDIPGAYDTVLETAYAGLNIYDHENVDKTLADSPLTTEWFSLRSHEFKGNEKDLMFTALAAIPAKRRDKVVALAEQYLRNNTLDTDQDRLEFITFFMQEARGQQNEELAERTTLGRIGEFVAAPFRASTEFVNDTVVRSIVGPEEYKWREPLSLGQNFALGRGVEPSDRTAWQLTSGTTDFLLNLSPLDPINFSVAVGVGAKLARTLPRVGALADATRGASALRVLVPFKGRKITQLPQFSRGPFTRAAWALFSGTHDELIERAARRGVFKHMHEVVANGGGVAELVEFYPELKGSLATIGQVLTSRAAVKGGEDFFKTMISAASRNLVEGPGRDLIWHATEDATVALGDFQRAVREGVASGELSVSSVRGLPGFDTGFQHADVYRFDGDELAPGSVLRLHETVGEGAEVVMLRGDVVKTFDLEGPGAVAELVKWARKQGGEASKAMDSVLAELGVTGGAIGDIIARHMAENQVFNRAMMRFGEAKGVELFASTSANILTERGLSKAIRAIDSDELGDAGKVLSGEYMNYLQAQVRLDTLRAGGHRTWFIKDIPTKVPAKFNNRMPIKGAWRRHGPTNVEGWWRNKKNALSTFFYNPRNPGMVNLGNAEEGARAMQIWLRRLGASRDFINKVMDDFIASPYERRYDIVRNAILDAAQDVEHPLLQYGIIDHIEKQGLRVYSFDDNGMELGVAAARGTDGKTKVAVPVIPSHTTAYIQLPGQHVFSSLRRFRRAKSQFRVMPALVEGIFPHTRKNRRELVKSYRMRLAGKGVSTEALSREHLAAMAYASVIPRKELDAATGKFVKSGHNMISGLGAIGQMANMLGRAYSVYHSMFSIAQLALRPISWPMRVLLEEQWRAAFFDLPSLFRNPVRQLASWHDAYYASRVSAWRKFNLRKARQLSSDIFSGAKGKPSEALIARAEEVIPDLKRLTGREEWSSVAQLRMDFNHILGNELLGGGHAASTLNPKGNALWRAMRKEKKIRRAETKLKEMGFAKDFDITDMAEIRNKGFAQLLIEEAAATTIPLEYAQELRQGMTPAYLYNYGTAYSRVLQQLVDDPVVGVFGLGRASEIASTGVATEFTGRNLVHNSGWQRIRSSIERVARERGVSPVNEVGLADWYLREIVDPLVDNHFRALWGDNIEDKARIAREIKEAKVATIEIGGRTHNLNFDVAGQHTLASNVRQFVSDYTAAPQAFDASGRAFPRKIAAYFEPRYMGEGPHGVRDPFLRRHIRTIMAISGDSISQGMNRRPAYLNAYRDYFRYYSELGFKKSVAQEAAHQKAAELVNYVFYNMENATPFLRSMNKISPFFSAWWEVAQTWAYKIPMLSAWGVGYPALVRKVDRVMDALVNMGIVEVSDDIDPDSLTRTRSMHLVFSSERDTGNSFADTLSKVGFHMWRAPALAVEHFVNMIQFGNDEEYGDSWKDKTEWRLGVGTPIDPFSHGLGAVNQAYLGTNPLIGRAATLAISKLPESVDYRFETAETGETLTEVAERLDIEIGRLLADNSVQLELALGKEQYRRLKGGELDASQVVVPEDFKIKIPDTNLWMRIMDSMFMPFGRVESNAGPIWQIAPSWGQKILQGFGLWVDGDNYDPEGSGFLSLVTTPQGRSAVESEILTQMMYLETDEGGNMLSKIMEESQALEDMWQEGKGIFLEESAEGEITITDHSHPLADDYQDQRDLVRRLNDEYLHRATSNAAGSLVMRGLVGAYSPSVPQMLHGQNRDIAAYYYARSVAQARERGEDVTEIKLPDLRLAGDKTYEAFLIMMREWLSNPEGDGARRFLKQNFPGLWAFSYGKTFWGPAGEPPEFQNFDQWSKQIEAGERDYFPPDVWLQRVLRSGLVMDKEVDIIENYGNTPESQVVGMLNDWHGYSELRKDYDVKFAALDFFDEDVNDGRYLNWVSRNEDDAGTLSNRLLKFVDNVAEVVDELTDPALQDVLSLSPEDRRQQAGQLRATARRLREAVTEWQQEYEQLPARRPRDRIISEYFQGPIADYYEGLADLYDEVDLARGSEERSRVYDEVRRWQNNVGMKPVTIGGLALPAPLEWRWNAMSPEDQADQVDRWIAQPPEWLSLWATKHMSEMSPGIQSYIPTSVEEFALYEEFSALKNDVGDMVEVPRGELTSLLTTGQETKVKAYLEALLYERLRADDRTNEIAWREMTPAQRLYQAGRLPNEVSEYIEEANAILDRLAEMDVGPGSQAGLLMFNYLANEIEAQIEVNPQLGDELVDIGQRLFDDPSLEGIVLKLFGGAVQGEL